MEYSNTISLIKNKRGCYDLDTSKGCTCGVDNNPRGCYGDCYAFRSAKRYGIDFSRTVFRKFKDENHKRNIISQINNIHDMPFIRIGVTGDPSEDWERTINTCRIISVNSQLYLFSELFLTKKVSKPIVIITKHWENLNTIQLKKLSNLDVCINTSVSALDESYLLKNRLAQYNKLKNYCKSVLRIVSCNFNLKNETGKKLYLVQKKLFKNEHVLDTVLRVSPNNELAVNGVINIERVKFLSQYCWASVYNKHTYFGACSSCPDMCGISLKN